MVSGVDGGPSYKSGPGAGAGGGVRDTNIRMCILSELRRTDTGLYRIRKTSLYVQKNESLNTAENKYLETPYICDSSTNFSV
jgi:hypothetical protein